MNFDFFGHAVGAEYGHGAGGHFIGFFDKDDALLREVFYDMGVVDNFMAHIDRRAEFGQRHFDDLNSALDAGASYAASFDALVPAGTLGPMYFIVKSDAFVAVYEPGRTANNVAALGRR